MKKTKIINITIKLILILFALAMIILTIGPLITVGEFGIGTGIGFTISALCITYALFTKKINCFFKNLWQKRAGKAGISIVCIILAVGIGISGTALGNLVSHQTKSDYKTEYVIVLGCQVNGERPGPFLYRRILAAYNYLIENENATAILSGGQGKRENISEAQCMYNMLTEKGIDPKRLIIEDKSTSTNENFANSVELLKQQGISINEITVVTNEFHEYRASFYASKHGLNAYSAPSKTPWNGYIPFVIREIIAIVAQIYFGL